MASMGEESGTSNADPEEAKLGRGPYRAAKPLSELIPPDRRWVRTLAVFVVGTAIGALAYHSLSLIRAAARGGVEVAPRIHAVTLVGHDGAVTLPVDRPAVVVNVWIQRDVVGKASSMLGGLGGLDEGTVVVDVLAPWIDASSAKANGAGSLTVMDDPGEYGLVRQLGITTFTTLVIDDQGVVRLVDYPGAKGFADRVIGAVRALSPGTPHPQPTAETPTGRGDDDPLHGHFTLEEATRDLHGKGPLLATIETSKGSLECKLYDDKAPNTVANFIGLATGKRTWKDPSTGEWTNRPAYDGTTFHRVIKGFMIQGGDPKGNGTGEPGYTIPDEMWEGAKHDRAGLLCMANRGPNTNGAQFFITEADGPSVTALDASHTYGIFGECTPLETIHTIAAVPTGPRDQPLDPVVIGRVRIARRP